MRQSTIRQWLILVLAVPLIGVTCLAWLRVSDASTHLRAVRADASAARTAAEPAALITALLNERNMSSVDRLGGKGYTLKIPNISTPAQAIEATDQQVLQLRSTLKDVDSSTRARYQKALASTIQQVGEARREYDRMVASGTYLDIPKIDRMFSTYTDAVQYLHSVNTTNTVEIDDAELRKRAQSAAAQSLITDLDAELVRPVFRVEAGTVAPIEARVEVARTLALWERAQHDAVELLDRDPVSQDVVHRYLERPSQDAFKASIDAFITDGKGGLAPAYEMIGFLSEVHSPTAPDAAEATKHAISERADTLIGDAESQRRDALLILLVTILASAAVGFVAARSLARPLSHVARGARELTDTQLPAMVETVLATPPGEAIVPGELVLLDHARIAEVDEVIDSLNGMAEEAARLAVGQASQLHNAADSLVNVGRRVQGLVGRQIELITGLEDDGLDVAQVDALLRLDQIASRIRRNADSMIVLAGAKGVTRRSQGDPMPVNHAITAAIADVEQFERVEASDIDPARVDGRLTTDLTHVIAELTENALSFSPPTEPVRVTGKFLGSGDYELSIEDVGIGMSPEEIEKANGRLRGEMSFGTEPTRFLGHWVVGAIASRQGLDVVLETNRNNGVTARIRLPETAVTDIRGEGDLPSETAATLGTLSFHDVISDRRSFDTLLR